jgi:hypothetical protein
MIYEDYIEDDDPLAGFSDDTSLYDEYYGFDEFGEHIYTDDSLLTTAEEAQNQAEASQPEDSPASEN